MSELKRFSEEAKVLGVNTPLWVFLDEINTCDSMGLLSEVVT